MKLIISIVLSLIAVLVIAVGIVALIGSRLPQHHVATRSITIRQPRALVYKLVRDVGSAASWRTDVRQIEIVSAPGEKVRFREHGKQGDVNYEISEDVPAEKMVTRILDTNLGYSGKWIYTFSEEPSGTRLTITEDGEVTNVIFRFMSKYVFGHTASIDGYLTALAKHFGETATPQ